MNSPEKPRYAVESATGKIYNPAEGVPEDELRVKPNRRERRKAVQKNLTREQRAEYDRVRASQRGLRRMQAASVPGAETVTDKQDALQESVPVQE